MTRRQTKAFFFRTRDDRPSRFASRPKPIPYRPSAGLSRTRSSRRSEAASACLSRCIATTIPACASAFAATAARRRASARSCRSCGHERRVVVRVGRARDRGPRAAGRERSETNLRVVLRQFLVHEHEAPERGLLRARAASPVRAPARAGARAMACRAWRTRSSRARCTPRAREGEGKTKTAQRNESADYVKEERGVQTRGVFRGPHASEVARDDGERVRQAHSRGRASRCALCAGAPPCGGKKRFQNSFGRAPRI